MENVNEMKTEFLEEKKMTSEELLSVLVSAQNLKRAIDIILVKLAKDKIKILENPSDSDLVNINFIYQLETAFVQRNCLLLKINSRIIDKL
jgi:hypothetical protein